MPFYYYTTAEQEAALTAIYEQELQQKQAQIDAEQRRTGRIQKFTAYAHISKAPRIFDVSGTEVTLEGYGPASLTKIDGGGTYMTDPSFDDKIADFLRRNSSYRVIFQPSGRWGPTVSYCSRGMPATFISEDGTETLNAEDEDKYDLCVG